MGTPLDLFAAASPEGAWSVAEVTRRARAVIEAGLPPLWVKGEVSGFKAYGSGHWYFTLRDKVAQLRCVMWSRDNQRLPAPPADGMEVFAFGFPTVWEERGEFRLTVRHLLSTEAGGLWQVAFEKARKALERDGLLDPARKRPLPALPRRIAVVTSPDGAAFRDIAAVLERRWPVDLVLVPTRVQGEGADREVCAALALLARIPKLDLAIVGRGGGSKEDLWTFNSERVARALAAVPVPVVSAVGHEVDVTLCDLVADLRAPTPSAAAVAATPDRNELSSQLDRFAQGLVRGLRAPTRNAGERLERARDRLSAGMARTLERSGARVAEGGARLDALSPLRVLARGYAVARDASGTVLRSVAQFPPGLAFRLRVRDGEVAARAGES
jgi:exodeoxyribonuclease VII large subunit